MAPRVLIIRFPNGSKEFRYPAKPLELGDIVSFAGKSFRVVEVDDDGGGVRVDYVAEPTSGFALSESQVHLLPI